MIPQELVGTTIGGRYRIDALLGQGGMAAVYRATDPNLRRKVAIKLIHPHLSDDPNFVYRFQEEAATVAGLRHPNIVQVHDFDADRGVFYMVMEYLVGETLQARLRRLNEDQRTMPVAEAVRFCAQVCDAAGYAHRHELIHRDIKPANIMLDLNGQAILMDFGIVKIVGGDSYTATGATVGTAMYMSPEQIRSERVDERSDIYALGVTLYEMIGGQPPYQADSALTVMMMVLNDPLPDLRQIRRGLPESLVAVVEKAMAKDKDGRYQSMAEMAIDLQKAAGEIAAGDQRIAYDGLDLDERVDSFVSPTAETVPPARKPAETGQLPRSSHRGSAHPIEGLGIGEEKQKLKAVQEPVGPPAGTATPFRRDGQTEIEDKTRSATKRFLVPLAILLLLAITIAGVLLVVSRKAPALQITPIESPRMPINDETASLIVSLGMWETGSIINDLVYSPDGRLIGTANNREGGLVSRYRHYGGLWQVDNSRLPTYLVEHSEWVNGVAFSADGQLFATVAEDHSIVLWYTAGGGLALKIESSIGELTNIDFAPNNQLLAGGLSNGDIAFWQVSDGRFLRKFHGHEDSVTGVRFSPDGTLLASGSNDQTLKLWQVSDGRLMATMRGHSEHIINLVFSPDGANLASASYDRTVGIWQVGDGALIMRLQGHSEPVYDVAFSADGSVVASGSADGSVRLWRVSDGELLQLLANDYGGVTAVAFSPDGSTLAAATTDGIILFWGLSGVLPGN